MGVCQSVVQTIDIKDLIEIEDIREDFGDFHLLGDGGSCNVFKVVRRSDKKTLALKKISKKNRAHFGLFQAEAQILQKLDFPNIQKLEAVYMDLRNYYIVSELYKGGDLLTHVKNKYGGESKSKFTEAFAAGLIIQIIDAISYIHSLNIVHRDIKPENFVFMEESENSRLVLIDFGIAKVVEDNQAYSELVGTPYYIAPEYLLNTERQGWELKASDVWSIGILGYILCTGRPPFLGNSNEEVFRKIISKPLKFPRKAKLSKPGKSFLKHVLKKTPEKRPSCPGLKEHPWLCGGAADQDLEIVEGLRSFDLKHKMRKLISKIVKENVQQGDQDLSVMFNDIDKNGDGQLDIDELSHFLISQGFPQCTVKDKAREIMQKLDGDADGELNIKEFEDAWVDFQLSDDEKIVASIFNCFDENGDGMIDSNELRAVIGDDAEDMQKIFDLFDDDGNGEVSYDEFAKALEEIGFITKAQDNGLQGLFKLEMNDVHLDFASDGDEPMKGDEQTIYDQAVSEEVLKKAVSAGIDF